jgi:hypothetical protein
MTNLIINPNAPPPKQKSELDYILDTMKVIAQFRLEYLDLEKRIMTEELTASQLEELAAQQNNVAIKMVSFIVTGKI